MSGDDQALGRLEIEAHEAAQQLEQDHLPRGVDVLDAPTALQHEGVQGLDQRRLIGNQIERSMDGLGLAPCPEDSLARSNFDTSIR